MSNNKKVLIDLPIEIYQEFYEMAVKQGVTIEEYISHSLTDAVTMDIADIYSELLSDNPIDTKPLQSKAKKPLRNSHLRII